MTDLLMSELTDFDASACRACGGALPARRAPSRAATHCSYWCSLVTAEVLTLEQINPWLRANRRASDAEPAARLHREADGCAPVVGGAARRKIEISVAPVGARTLDHTEGTGDAWLEMPIDEPLLVTVVPDRVLGVVLPECDVTTRGEFNLVEARRQFHTPNSPTDLRHFPGAKVAS